ncbi:protein kinase [Nocardia xishanensis]|uniref:serine/threonine-protein kinase n=1 Tax=Nocardia xishanensis TaxID=238964 RepID=UPI00340FB766
MLRTGEIFAGYVVKRVLGQGGMGTVYLAQHPRLPRMTALKLLDRELYGDLEIRGRFEREADLVAQLDHPNIVTVYDRGAEDEQLWISMQFVPGSDAASADVDVLAAWRAVQIIAETAAALDFAHANGVLHRDVKPANILLAKAPIGQPERVLLTDFGIAGMRNADTTLTSAGTITATLAYAAPEQLSGQPLDHRADQYSLACTLFWMLTGNVPFPGATPAAVMNGHIGAPVPSLSRGRRGLPAALDAVMARALAKRPADRFPSCTDFAVAARHALASGAPIPPAPHSPTGSVPPHTGFAPRADATPPAHTGFATQAAPPSPHTRFGPGAHPSHATGPQTGSPNVGSPAHTGPAPSTPAPQIGGPPPVSAPAHTGAAAHGRSTQTGVPPHAGARTPGVPPHTGFVPQPHGPAQAAPASHAPDPAYPDVSAGSGRGPHTRFAPGGDDARRPGAAAYPDVPEQLSSPEGRWATSLPPHATDPSQPGAPTASGHGPHTRFAPGGDDARRPGAGAYPHARSPEGRAATSRSPHAPDPSLPGVPTRSSGTPPNGFVPRTDGMPPTSFAPHPHSFPHTGAPHHTGMPGSAAVPPRPPVANQTGSASHNGGAHGGTLPMPPSPSAEDRTGGASHNGGVHGGTQPVPPSHRAADRTGSPPRNGTAHGAAPPGSPSRRAVDLTRGDMPHGNTWYSHAAPQTAFSRPADVPPTRPDAGRPTGLPPTAPLPNAASSPNVSSPTGERARPHSPRSDSDAPRPQRDSIDTGRSAPGQNEPVPQPGSMDIDHSGPGRNEPVPPRPQQNSTRTGYSASGRGELVPPRPQLGSMGTGRSAPGQNEPVPQQGSTGTGRSPQGHSEPAPPRPPRRTPRPITIALPDRVRGRIAPAGQGPGNSPQPPEPRPPP